MGFFTGIVDKIRGSGVPVMNGTSVERLQLVDGKVGITDDDLFVALMDELRGVDRQEGIPNKRVQRLYLPGDAKGWNVYRAGGPWIVGHQVGRLQQAKFGGLDYEILSWKIPGVVAVIKTQDFGVVGIYVAAGTGAVIE